jgi:hypothetical protein
MKSIKSIILLFSLSIILNSCSYFGEAGDVLRNEKRQTNDEFLIKKKDPLTQPPDFEKIPEPRSATENNELKQNSLEKILKTDQKSSGADSAKSSSAEESILKKIKK